MQAYISKPDAEGSPWLTAKEGELMPASDAIRQVPRFDPAAPVSLAVLAHRLVISPSADTAQSFSSQSWIH